MSVQARHHRLRVTAGVSQERMARKALAQQGSWGRWDKAGPPLWPLVGARVPARWHPGVRLRRTIGSSRSGAGARPAAEVRETAEHLGSNRASHSGPSAGSCRPITDRFGGVLPDELCQVLSGGCGDRGGLDGVAESFQERRDLVDRVADRLPGGAQQRGQRPDLCPPAVSDHGGKQPVGQRERAAPQGVVPGPLVVQADGRVIEDVLLDISLQCGELACLHAADHRMVQPALATSWPAPACIARSTVGSRSSRTGTRRTPCCTTARTAP